MASYPTRTKRRSVSRNSNSTHSRLPSETSDARPARVSRPQPRCQSGRPVPTVSGQGAVQVVHVETAHPVETTVLPVRQQGVPLLRLTVCRGLEPAVAELHQGQVQLQPVESVERVPRPVPDRFFSSSLLRSPNDPHPSSTVGDRPPVSVGSGRGRSQGVSGTSGPVPGLVSSTEVG